MGDDRQELAELRRLDELEQKANGGGNYQSPGESSENSYLANVKARVVDPNRLKGALGFGPAKKEVIEGELPYVLPQEMAPAALSKLGHFLTGTRTARVATGAGMGAAMNSNDRLEGALTGGGIAAGLEAAIPVVGAIAGGTGKVLNTIKQAYNSHINPAGVEQELSSTFGQAAKNIAEKNVEEKASEVLSKLTGTGKTATIIPSQFEGTAAYQELERIARAQGSNVSVPNEGGIWTMPQKLTVTPSQAQRLKEIAQDAANYKPQPGTLMPTDYPATNAAEKAAASKLKSTVEGIAPEVQAANAKIAEQTRVGQAAGKVAKNPSPVLGNSLKQRALVQKTEEMSGIPIKDRLETIKAGEKISKKPVSPSTLAELIKAALKGGWKGLGERPGGLAELIQGKKNNE